MGSAIGFWFLLLIVLSLNIDAPVGDVGVYWHLLVSVWSIDGKCTVIAANFSVVVGMVIGYLYY